MNYCPRDFHEDMTDPINLAYCREVQRQNGDACSAKRCPYCLPAEDKPDRREPDRPDPVQRGLF